MNDWAGKWLDRYLQAWRQLGVYERFEQVIAIFLTGVIAVVILASCVRLFETVFHLFLVKADLSDFAVFQVVFGMILTTLIALEFNHSIVQVVERKQSLVQVRIVVQIAVLALVRKFILLDLTKMDHFAIFGLSSVIVALAGLYWTVFAHERRRAAGRPDS